MLALPIRLGGIRVPSPFELSAKLNYLSSSTCSPLIDLILNEPDTSNDIVHCMSKQKEIKGLVKKGSTDSMKAHAIDVRNNLDSTLQLSLDLAAKKGASIWLSALPIQAHGFSLSKSEFRDALRLRYN